MSLRGDFFMNCILGLSSASQTFSETIDARLGDMLDGNIVETEGHF